MSYSQPDDSDSCPYRGLEPFTNKDRDFFFGRESEQEELGGKLAETKLTILYGASGVGKSSVLMAGVLPYLKNSRRVVVVLFREWQHADFMTALKKATLGAACETLGSRPPEPGAGTPGEGAEEHQESSRAAHEVNVRPQTSEFIALLAELGYDGLVRRYSFTELIGLCNKALNCPVLFIFDQFEDFLSYRPPSAKVNGAPECFDDEFALAVNRQDIPAKFLLSLREDSLSKLDRFKGRIPSLMGNLQRLEHLHRDAARNAIIKPLHKYNDLNKGRAPVDIQPELIEQLLDDVRMGKVGAQVLEQGAEPADSEDEDRIETPYLQLVLLRLWEAESKAWGAEPGDGVRLLRRATLTDALGGVIKVVRAHLDEVMARLSKLEPEISLGHERILAVAALLFRFLVTRTGITPAYSAEDLSDLLELQTEDQREEVRNVLRLLASQNVRILRAVRPAAAHGSSPLYKVSHDVLAPAILDWRTRYVEQRAREEAERRLEEQTRKLESEKREQREETARATSRELAAAAINNLTVDPERSLLLAWYATRLGDEVGVTAPPEAVEALFKSLQASCVRVTIRGHESKVHSVTFDRDGRRLLTAAADGTARIWEAQTGQQLAKFHAEDAPWHQRWILAAVFSPSEERVVTAGEDGVLRVWDVASERQINYFPLSTKPLEALAYDRHADRVVAAGGEGKIWVLSLEQGDKPRVLSGHEGGVNGLSFSPDSKLLASVGEDTIVRLWDMETCRLRSQLEGHTGWVKAVVFNRKGTLLATASHDGSAKVWRVPSGEPLQTLHHGSHWVLDVAFSPEGDQLLACYANGEAIVWTLLGRPLMTLLGHEEAVRGAAFSPQGRRVATASNDGAVKVWEVEGERMVLESHSMKLTGATFSPDGSLLATCSDDQTIKIWAADSGSLQKTLRGHKAYVSALAFHPSRPILASASWDKTIRLWDFASGAELARTKVDEHLLAVAFNHDGEFLASSGTSRTASVWRLRGQGGAGELERQATLRGHDLWVNSVAFSPDDKLLATTSDDKTVKVWDLASGQERDFRWNESLQGAAFCHDGARLLLAVASHGGELLVLDASPDKDQLQLLRSLTGHTKLLHHVTFSPDGHSIATASADRTVKVWDTSSGRPRVTLTGHAAVVWRVAFNPSGTKLATASWDRTARVWDVRTGQEELVLNWSAHYSRRYHLDTGGWLYTVKLSTMQELACKRLTRSFTEYECNKYLHRPDCRSVPDPRSSTGEGPSR